jgi:hypothetical protein
LALTAAGENEPKPVVMLGLTSQAAAGLALNAPRPKSDAASHNFGVGRFDPVLLKSRMGQRSAFGWFELLGCAAARSISIGSPQTVMLCLTPEIL